MTEPLLNTPEVARILNVHPKTVGVWVKEGRLPCVRLAHRCLRFDPTALDAFVQSHTTTATAGDHA